MPGCPSALRLQIHAVVPVFSVGSGYLNTGPHACPASTLPFKPVLQYRAISNLAGDCLGEQWPLCSKLYMNKNKKATNAEDVENKKFRGATAQQFVHPLHFTSCKHVHIFVYFYTWLHTVGAVCPMFSFPSYSLLHIIKSNSTTQ